MLKRINKRFRTLRAPLFDGALRFKDLWNATTNDPTLTSGVGTNGEVYIVNVAGSTNLDGITDWEIGDWAIFVGTVWKKADNSSPIVSVFGRIGVVVATAGDYAASLITNDSGVTGAFVKDALNTLGTALGAVTWNDVMHQGAAFTIADAEGLSAVINQNDVTGNPPGLIINNAGTGDDVQINNSVTNKRIKIKKALANNLASIKDSVSSVGTLASALHFNGVNGYTQTPNNASLEFTTDFTLGFWMRPTNITQTSAIVGRYESTANNRIWLVEQLADELRIFVYANGTSGSVGSFGTNAAPLTTAWQHIMIVYTAAAQTLDIYHNAVMQAGTVSGVIPTSMHPSSIAEFRMGTLFATGTPGVFYDGDLDEAGIWDRALVASDALDLYDSGVGLFIDKGQNFPTSGTSQGLNLQLLYHLNEETGTILTDSSDNTNTGATVNMIEADWITGKVTDASESKEITVLQSRNGISEGEFGAVKLGADNVRATINGKTIRFNINGTEFVKIDGTGIFKVISANPESWLEETTGSKAVKSKKVNLLSEFTETSQVFEPSGTASSALNARASLARAELASSIVLGTASAPWSISFWIFPLSGVQDAFANFMSESGNASALAFLNSNRQIQVFNAGSWIGTGLTLTNDVWNHVVLKNSGGSNIISLYKNSVFVENRVSATFTGIFTWDLIGGRNQAVSSALCDMEQVDYWSKSLSGPEISQLYNGGNGLYAQTSVAPYTSGMVAGWRFDENSGSTSAEWLNDTNDATFAGGATWQPTGVVPGIPQLQAANLFSHTDGINPLERGIFIIGDSLGRTVLDGRTIRLNIAGAQVGQVDESASFLWDNAMVISGRLKETQGADVASANDLATGDDGNTFEITGATQINRIDNTNWQNGSKIELLFTSTPIVKDAQASAGSDITILLAGSADAAMTAGSRLKLKLCEIGGVQAWRENGRTFV